MNFLADLNILFVVALAMLMGGVIGMERELSNKPAGFRTHMLVAGAAALFVRLGEALVLYFDQIEQTQDILRADPFRIVEAIVTGISFLGAGTIFLAKDSKVQGLTTAASLLYSSGIGMALGLRRYLLGIGVTLLGLIILWILGYIENKTIEKQSGG